MKKIYLLAFSLLLSTNVNAGVCGIGKVIEILEGHWESNDMVLRIDYSVLANAHPGTNFHGDGIAYKRDSLNVRKYEGIRDLARLAFIHNYNVSTYSHNDDCSNATFLSVYK